MSGNRYIRRGSRAPKEPKIGRMFLVSLGLHLLLFLIFSGVLVFKSERDRRPVYYVDLTKLPVAKPQAGRPDAKPKPTKQAPKKTVQKTVKKTAKETPVKKTVSKPPATSKSTVPTVSDAEIQKKLKAMQEKQQRDKEIDDLKAKLAALAAGDSRDEDVLTSDAPLGEPDAQGDEAGISQLRWLEEFIKANWSLSQYQVRRTDLEATVWVIYNRDGRLVEYFLQEPSGEKVFDDSIKKAVFKSDQLSFEPQFANQKITITFNLKDLLER